MKKTILIAAVIFTSVFAQADVFENYQQTGRSALSLIANQPTQTPMIINEINLMIGFGYEIMDQFAVKYPECQTQYAQLKELSAGIDQLSYEEIDNLYHDGKGLVEAPRLCYRGRSLVVHPYQVIALIKENRMVSDAVYIEEEMNEVIDRADTIKEMLQN